MWWYNLIYIWNCSETIQGIMFVAYFITKQPLGHLSFRSFFQYAERYPAPYFSRFRWTWGCSASAGALWFFFNIILNWISCFYLLFFIFPLFHSTRIIFYVFSLVLNRQHLNLSSSNKFFFFNGYCFPFSGIGSMSNNLIYPGILCWFCCNGPLPRQPQYCVKLLVHAASSCWSIRFAALLWSSCWWNWCSLFVLKTKTCNSIFTNIWYCKENSTGNIGELANY